MATLWSYQALQGHGAVSNKTPIPRTAVALLDVFLSPFHVHSGCICKEPDNLESCQVSIIKGCLPFRGLD